MDNVILLASAVHGYVPTADALRQAALDHMIERGTGQIWAVDQVRYARQRRVVHRGPVRDHADSHAASRRRSSAMRHNT
jgi:hypothetical protein